MDENDPFIWAAHSVDDSAPIRPISFWGFYETVLWPVFLSAFLGYEGALLIRFLFS
jgi:hypothetical protein